MGYLFMIKCKNKMPIAGNTEILSIVKTLTKKIVVQLNT